VADGSDRCIRACGKKDPGGGTSCGGNGDCAKCWSITLNGKTNYSCYPLNYTPNDIDNVSRPTTVAAFLSTVGSPDQQDVFTGRSSAFYAQKATIWNLASADNNRCTCGTVAGCERGKCGLNDNYKCYAILPIVYDINGNFKVLKSFFACIQDRYVYVGTSPTDSHPLYQYQPWPDGQYTDDPTGNSSSRRREDGAKPIFRNPDGLGTVQS
jgi:hypothetical protein